MGSFLTPDGYEGQDDNWGVMSYTTVIAELKLVLESNSVSQDVALIISHYVELIERKIVPSQALIDACKSIYQQHRAAVDLIVQHGQEPQLSQAFEQFTRAGNRALKTTAIRSSTVHFLFESWLHIDNYPHADRKRWSSEFPVLFWFEVGSKQLYLRLEVGPFLEVTLRSPIVNRLQAKLKEKEPKQGGKGNGETYTRIITYKTSISEDPTVDELVGAMEKTWKDASQHDLEQTIRAVLTHSAS